MRKQTSERRHAIALKRAIVRLIERGMSRERIGRPDLARRTRTTCAQVDRLLDPANPAVRLDATMKAARAVKQKLRIVLDG